MAKKRPPKVIRDHWDRVAKTDCIISGRPGPTIHHCHSGSMTEVAGLKGGALKSSDWLVIPLDAEYHTGNQGIDAGIGVHTWEKKYGTQVDFLDNICVKLGLNVWKKAGIQREVPGLD